MRPAIASTATSAIIKPYSTNPWALATNDMRNKWRQFLCPTRPRGFRAPVLRRWQVEPRQEGATGHGAEFGSHEPRQRGRRSEAWILRSQLAGGDASAVHSCGSHQRSAKCSLGSGPGAFLRLRLQLSVACPRAGRRRTGCRQAWPDGMPRSRLRACVGSRPTATAVAPRARSSPRCLARTAPRPSRCWC
jgi:hypothetical protein